MKTTSTFSIGNKPSEDAPTHHGSSGNRRVKARASVNASRMKWQRDGVACWLAVGLLLSSLFPQLAWAQCPGSTPGVQARWDFNTSTVSCNGATARPLDNLGPLFQGNVYSYCPNVNNGCGQATLGSRGHRSDVAFGNGLSLANFYNAAAMQAQGGAAYDPTSLTFNVESAANLIVTHTIPAGRSGCLNSFALNVLQKQFTGTVNFAKQGVAVKRNGVLIYNQAQPILASQVNGAPLSFSFTGGNFCYDGSSAVTFEIIFGLVQQLTPLGVSGSPATTGYDDITLSGTCSDSGNPVAEITPATCGTAGVNADGRIILRNSNPTDRFDLSSGPAYTGTASYSTATPIGVSGVVASTLANPASTTLYTVRVFTAAGCTTDLTVTLEPTVCPGLNCLPPTATATATPASCSGNSVLSNASISLTGLSGGDRVGFSVGTAYTGPIYTKAQSFTGSSTAFTNLPNPNGTPETYVVRVFNGSEFCFRDLIVTMPIRSCACQRVTIQIKRAGQPDPNSTPNNNVIAEDDLVSYEVCPSNEFIDLKLAHTVSPTSGSTCPANTNFVWRTVLTNAGWMEASNIQISNLLPAGLQVVSATATAGTYGAGTGWQVPTLAASGSVTLLITTRATQPGQYTSCAWVSNAFPLNDPNSSPFNGASAGEDDGACAQITVIGQAAPVVTLAFDPVGIRPNTPVRLTMRINNPRSTPMTLTQAFVNTLPGSPAAMSIAASPNLVVNNGVPVIAAAGSGLVFIPNGSVLPPGLTQIQLDVVVPALGTYCNVLPAGALQTDACASAESVTACLVANESFVMAPLVSKVFTPQTVQTNQTSTLTLTLTNRNVNSLTLTQPLSEVMPNGVIAANLIASTCGSVSITGGGSLITLATGSVIASGSCVISVQVSGSATGTYCSQTPINALVGSVGSVLTGNEAISDACLKIVNTPIFDLALRAGLAPGQDSMLDVGNVVSYQVQVFNQGTVDATNIQITDYLPTGMTLVSSPGWSMSGVNAVRSLSLLAAGQDIMLPIQLQVTAGISGSALINRLEISAASGGTDIDSRPDSNSANDAGGLPRSPSDDSVNGDGTGVPDSPLALRDEDDADPVYASVRTCVNNNLAIGTVLAPTTIRTENDVVQVTFGIVNNSNTPLTNPAFSGQIRLFNSGSGGTTSLTATQNGDVGNDGILQPNESWLYTSVLPSTQYQPGDVFLVYGTATALCGTTNLQTAGGELLFTEGVNVDVVVSASCVRPGQTIDVDLITRLLIDEDAATNPGSITIGNTVIQLAKRRYEGRNLRLQSPLLNGGQPFDPFNPPSGIDIDVLVDQNGADAGRNQDNVLDETESVNTARKPCSTTGQNDVGCDFPDWVFRVKLTIPSNYTASTLVIQASDSFDLFESIETPVGGNSFANFTSLGTAGGVDSETITIAPNAGTDQTLVCATNTLTTSTTLQPSPTGGTWSQIGTIPTVATLNGNLVSSMTVAGTYQFAYTFNGCRDTVAVTVQPCAPVCALSMTLTPGLCQSATNTFTLTGRAGITNAPASGTLTISSSVFGAPIVQGLPAGNSSGPLTVNNLSSNGQAFVVTVSHSNSACPSISQTVVAPLSCVVVPPCSASLVVTPGGTSATICPGGSATLLASGGTLYQFSDGTLTSSARLVVSPLSTTVYSVTVTNSNNCTAVAMVTVTVNGQPQITGITRNSACANGVASLTVNATNTGAGTLEYSLNNGPFQNTNSFTISAPGNTTANLVVRTQGSTCRVTETVVVNCACQNPASVTFVPNVLQTCAGLPVSFTVNVSGVSSASLSSNGTGTFSQTTINGLTTLTYQPSVADATTGSVTLTIQSADPDGAGDCQPAQLNRVLTVNPLPTITVASVTVCTGSTSMLSASGGATYRWSTGQTTASLSVSVAGTYSVTGTTAQGCSSTTSAGVVVQSCTVATSIILTGPGNTSTSTQPVVSGTATPGTVLVITDANGTTLCSTTATGNGIFSCVVNVPLGANTLTITGSGPGGTTSVTTSFTSIPPPTVSLTVPPSSTNSSPVISGTVTPGSVISITGPDGSTLCSTTATNGTFACPITVAPGPQSLTVTVCDAGGCSPSVLSFTTTSPAGTVSLQVRVLLQGGLAGVTSGTLMRDLLRSGGYLPLTTPYSASVSPRFMQNGGGGNETTTPAVLSANAGTENAIVDWVLVELRSEAAPNVVVATRSGLLQRDGDVVSPTDGMSVLSFTGLSGSMFYVSVKHRNHLGVMTALPVPLSGFSTLADFTTMTDGQIYDKPGSISFDGFEMITINGKRALWAGDANADGKVKYVGSAADVSRILSDVLTFQSGSPSPTYNFDFALGYFYGDVDLNGKVKYQGSAIDTSWIFSNVVVNYTLNSARLYNYDFMIEQLP